MVSNNLILEPFLYVPQLLQRNHQTNPIWLTPYDSLFLSYDLSIRFALVENLHFKRLCIHIVVVVNLGTVVMYSKLAQRLRILNLDHFIFYW